MTTDPADDGNESGSPLTPDERAELARLRRTELARLRTEAAGGPAGPGGPVSTAPRHRVRSFCAAVLIVIGCVLAPLSVVSVWVASIATDTDRYVATVAPLADSEPVRDAIAARVAAEVSKRLDVNDLLQQITPGDRPLISRAISGLSGPINSAVADLVQTQTKNVVSSQWFRTFWRESNRQVHASVVKALTGQGGGSVQLTDDAVVIDLAPVIDQVKQRLVSSGVGVAARIPEVHTQITVFSAENIGKAKTYFRLLRLAGDWLPVIAVLLAAAGVLLSGRRRRALVATALGAAFATLVLGIALTVFRGVYLDALPADVSQSAAGDVFDTLVRFLRTTVRTVVVLGLAVALGAWLSGGGHWALQARSVWTSTLGGARAAADRAGLRTGPVGPWVQRSRAWLVWLFVLAAGVALAVWSYPTAWVVVGLALAVVFALAVIEFLAEGPRPTPAAGQAPDGGPPAPGPGN